MFTLFVVSEPPSAIAPAPIPAATATETPVANASLSAVDVAEIFALVEETLEPSTRAVTVSPIGFVASATAAEPETETAPDPAIETVTAVEVVVIVAESLPEMVTAPPVTELPFTTAASTWLPIVFVAKVTAPPSATETVSMPKLSEALTATGVAVMLDSSEAPTSTVAPEARTVEPSTSAETVLWMSFNATAPLNAMLTAPSPKLNESDAATGTAVMTAWSVAVSVRPPGAVIVDPLTTPAAATVALVLVTAAPPSAIAPEKVPEAATATATPTATESSVGFVSAVTVTAPVAVTVEPSTVALTFSLTSSRATDTESATLMPAAPAATETEAATAVVLIVAVS